jgi:hypothetical protein
LLEQERKRRKDGLSEFPLNRLKRINLEWDVVE